MLYNVVGSALTSKAAVARIQGGSLLEKPEAC